MKSRARMPSFLKLILLTTLVLVTNSTTLAKAQLSGCNFEATEIEKCLIEQEGSLISPKPCCEALNRAIQVGFSCLCTLITTSSNGPHLSILLSGSLISGCEISTPPINLCQVYAPTPVFLPTEPEWPEDQLSAFTSFLKGLDLIETQPPPAISQELYVPVSHPSNCNFMEGGRVQPCLENGDGSSWNWDWFKAFNMHSSEGNKEKAFLGLSWLIVLVVCGELLIG